MKRNHSFAQFKARALARPRVRHEYDRLAEEFTCLDAILTARADAGLTQAEVAERIGSDREDAYEA